MPAAMIIGALFNGFFDNLWFLPPYLIFGMLFITFCRISVKDIKVTGLHWILLAFQILGGLAIYLLLYRIDPVVAQGLMMCAFTSVAMGAVVIGGMLGANIATMTTFTLISNLGVAIAAPVFFSAIAANPEISFTESAVMILSKVGPVLVLPFAGAWLLEIVWPKAHETVKKANGLSFWLWTVSLAIVVGRTVKFMLDRKGDGLATGIWLAAGALVICLIQFRVGRYFGRKYGDTVAGGQSMGQKNTILAIWMTQTYLDPLASVAPAAYVIWQNIVNSWQLWRYKGNQSK